MDQFIDNNETIKSIAIKLLESKFKHETSRESLSHAIFIMGTKKCGKSALMNILLEKDNIQNETIGLEYTYGRKNVRGHLNDKNICHIWELGGDMFRTMDILKVPFQAHKDCPMTIIIMVDLSQPNSLWMTLETCIESLKTLIEKNNFYNLKQNMSEKNSDNLHIFPLPLLIIGGKYDLFAEFDTNIKKLINKTLRIVALLLGAHLMYFTKTDQNFKKKMKDILNHIGFGTEQKVKSFVVDTNKPLFIMPSNDSWESIGINSISWDANKTSYVSQFSQIQINMTVPDDPSLEINYREPLIDIARNQKDEELKILLDKSTRFNF